MFRIAALQCNNFRTPAQRSVIYRYNRSNASVISEEAMARRSRLHIPQHHSRPGEEPDFSYLRDVAGRCRAAPRRECPGSRHRQPCRSTSCACSTTPRRGRPMESAPGGPGPADRPAPHAAHAHVRRSHAAHAAPGQDVLLHELPRRGSGVGRAGHGAASEGHAVSVLSQTGTVHRPRATSWWT